jgi:hypothetical protein
MTPAQQEAYVRARQKLDEENAAKERALRDAQGAAVSEQDQGWDAGKTALALGRGTGEGVAATADLPIQAGQWLWEVAKNAALEATGTPYERQAVSSPLADLYNENMPAAPAGYENVNDIAAIVGPALIETIATGGAGKAPQRRQPRPPPMSAPALSAVNLAALSATRSAVILARK